MADGEERRDIEKPGGRRELYILSVTNVTSWSYVSILEPCS